MFGGEGWLVLLLAITFKNNQIYVRNWMLVLPNAHQVLFRDQSVFLSWWLVASAWRVTYLRISKRHFVSTKQCSKEPASEVPSRCEIFLKVAMLNFVLSSVVLDAPSKFHVSTWQGLKNLVSFYFHCRNRIKRKSMCIFVVAREIRNRSVHFSCF